MIVGVAAWTAYRGITSLPFCESCNRWTVIETEVQRLNPCGFQADALERVKAGDLAALAHFARAPPSAQSLFPTRPGPMPHAANRAIFSPSIIVCTRWTSMGSRNSPRPPCWQTSSSTPTTCPGCARPARPRADQGRGTSRLPSIARGRRRRGTEECQRRLAARIRRPATPARPSPRETEQRRLGLAADLPEDLGPGNPGQPKDLDRPRDGRPTRRRAANPAPAGSPRRSSRTRPVRSPGLDGLEPSSNQDSPVGQAVAAAHEGNNCQTKTVRLRGMVARASSLPRVKKPHSQPPAQPAHAAAQRRGADGRPDGHDGGFGRDRSERRRGKLRWSWEADLGMVCSHRSTA